MTRRLRKLAMAFVHSFCIDYRSDGNWRWGIAVGYRERFGVRLGFVSSHGPGAEGDHQGPGGRTGAPRRLAEASRSSRPVSIGVFRGAEVDVGALEGGGAPPRRVCNFGVRELGGGCKKTSNIRVPL